MTHTKPGGVSIHGGRRPYNCAVATPGGCVSMRHIEGGKIPPYPLLYPLIVSCSSGGMHPPHPTHPTHRRDLVGLHCPPGQPDEAPSVSPPSTVDPPPTHPPQRMPLPRPQLPPPPCPPATARPLHASPTTRPPIGTALTTHRRPARWPPWEPCGPWPSPPRPTSHTPCPHRHPCPS